MNLIRFFMNEREVETTLPAGTAALDFIRDHQKLPGTKEGCREGECGACTVLVGELNGDDAGGNVKYKVKYKTVASCLLPLGELHGKHVVTVEGINRPDGLTPIQQALTDEGASQCGYCTPGIVMSLTGFFLFSENLDITDAVDALDGNICRCTGYVSIQRAAKQLCDSFASKLDKEKDRVDQLVEWEILPGYFKDIPHRLKELRESYPAPSAQTSQGVIVAGGTDLFVQQPGKLLESELEFISQRKGMSYIRKEKDEIRIGAGTTVEEIKHSPLINELFPRMSDYLNLVSSTIMRNRATLAGNIVNASPIGDMSIILLALDARLSLVKGKGKREVPLKHFFKGYKQMDKKEGEIIDAVIFPVPAEGTCFHFEKVSRRKYLDIASANTAVSVAADGDKIKDIRLSAGGVSPIPLYLEKTCAFLKGKEITADNIGEAVKVMEQEISPISDVRGSAQYKSLLLRNLIYAHFMFLFPEKDLVLKPAENTEETEV
jgi:xanthine dehydrogenase small subunit